MRRASPAGRPPELRVEAPERCGPEGVLRDLDRDELARRLGELPGDVEAVGVCLLWGFRHPAHERAVADEALPDAHVSLSHEVAGVFREYERLATTVVDAALSPLLSRYLARLTERTGDAGLPEPEVMLSSGGVAAAATAAATRVLDGAVGPGRRRGGRRTRRSAAAEPWASTWAARRATCRSSSTAAWR